MSIGSFFKNIFKHKSMPPPKYKIGKKIKYGGKEMTIVGYGYLPPLPPGGHFIRTYIAVYEDKLGVLHRHNFLGHEI